MIYNKEKLLKKIENFTVNSSKYELVLAKNNQYSLKVKVNDSDLYLHSIYNPDKSAEDYAKANYRNNKNIVIYGLGFGYHIKHLINLLSTDQTLYIFEGDFNIMRLAFQNTDIIKYISYKNVIFYGMDNPRELSAKLVDALQQPDAAFLTYLPSFKAIPDNLSNLKDILNFYLTNINSSFLNDDEALNNIEINKNYPDGGKLFKDKLRNIPSVIISAGPSLRTNSHLLSKAKEKALLIAVFRTVNYLHEINIQPDFYVISDSKSVILKNVNLDFVKSPIFLLKSAFSGVSTVDVPKFVLYSKNDPDYHEKKYAVEYGGSVATLAQSLSVIMGCNPIIFIGQDLCRVDPNITHVQNRVTGRTDIKGAYHVKATDGNSYYSPNNLYHYLKWIERFISRNKSTSFLNATSLGADISGAPHIDFEKYLEDLPYVRDKIDRITNY